MLHSNNITVNTDAYKFSHYQQMPPESEFQSSYVEARGGWDKSVMFGAQMFLKEYLSVQVTTEMVDYGERISTGMGLPFNRAGWDYIVQKCNGYLPLEIRAVPEGTVVPVHNILSQVINTDRECEWLTSYIETAYLRAIWYPTTVATNSYLCKEIIWYALQDSSDDPASQIDFKLHDFGARGVSSFESAAIGGLAHLVNFKGTDTVSAVVAAMEYYNEPNAGFSIPASEHSTITSWDNEVDAFQNMLDKFAKPGAIVACVSDSYDIYHAVDVLWGEELKEQILASGATLVVRPDSGRPERVPVECVERLADKFGFTVNSKGYKVLPDCVRVIQGDGITKDTIQVILDNLLHAGFSADNIAFGMGGGLLQMVNRDDLQFAMKCSAIRENGDWKDVFKNPVGDQGKKSKKGVMKLIKIDGEFKTVRVEEYPEHDDIMQLIYKNGKIYNEETLSVIRERAAEAFK